MSTFLLEETGELPLEFEGECIFAESSDWINGVENNRHHAIKIYIPKDDKSDRILQIEYISRWRGEPSSSNLWELQSSKEVMEVLEEYDPLKYLIGFPSGEHFKEKQHRLENQIQSNWLGLKSEALKALGLKRSLKEGKPPHPLGTCANAGWSIPEKIRNAAKEKAQAAGQSPSEFITELLGGILL